MRIVGGDLGGRKFDPPSRMPHTRPTTDVAKEGLFNIIENNLEIQLLKTLDLFGGTGNISYELASRGAKNLTIVENDPVMIDFIKKTSVIFGIENFAIIRKDVFKYLEQCTEKFDFIFAGPPYALPTIDRLPMLIIEKQILNSQGWFVLEHTTKNDYHSYENFVRERNYGTTVFSIFVNK